MKIQQIINQTGSNQFKVENDIITFGNNKEINLHEPIRCKFSAKHLNLDNVYKTQELYIANVELTDKLLHDFNFDREHYGIMFKELDGKDNGEYFKKIVEFVNDPYYDKGFKSLLFYGEDSYGTGKTQSIHSIAFEWYNNPLVDLIINAYGEVILNYVGVSIQVIREEDLMLRIRNTFDNKESKENESQIYKELGKYDILAIDDVGKYKANDMNFYRRVMFQIIDTRYNDQQGVIISSNLSKDNLGRFLGKAIVDRLRGMSKNNQFEFKGQSHRGQ